MARKSAAGSGTIRKKTVTRNGKQYTYWEARYTTGYDTGTGRQIQRSITGKTQKEVAQKLKAATAAIDAGTYTAPSKMTFGAWLDVWTGEYLGGVKPRTAATYKSAIDTRIKPALGAVRLEAMTAHQLQSFYNGLLDPNQTERVLSPKMVKNIHGIIHKALQQAVLNGIIRFNPATACVLPRIDKREIQPLDEVQISEFLKEIRGNRYEAFFTVALFTGMRKSELLGLTWDCVDFRSGTIVINKQLQNVVGVRDKYHLVSTKNGKGRVITPAPTVMRVLRDVKQEQLENYFHHHEYYDDESPFVFTDGLGNHLKPKAVYDEFKKVVTKMGLPEVRLHDLRHSYAVASIRSGDDIKTVQDNLGHATAAFTLDVYGHVTAQMKQASAERMERFIAGVK